MARPKSYKGKEPFIFISYSHENIPEVDPLIVSMQKRNYRLWFDEEGITPGRSWRREIAQRVKQCNNFLAFVSKTYVESPNCADEIFYAKKKEKNVLLVYLDDVELEDDWEMSFSEPEALYRRRYDDIEKLVDLIETIDDIGATKSAVVSAVPKAGEEPECTATAEYEPMGTAALPERPALDHIVEKIAHPYILPSGMTEIGEDDFPLNRWCWAPVRSRLENQYMSIFEGTDTGKDNVVRIKDVDAEIERMLLPRVVQGAVKRLFSARLRKESADIRNKRVLILLQAASMLEALHHHGLAVGCFTPEIAMVTWTESPRMKIQATIDGNEIPMTTPYMYLSEKSSIRYLGQPVNDLPEADDDEPDFIAPEIRKGEGVQVCSDVYSLGVLLQGLLLQEELLMQDLSESTRAALKLVEEKATAADPRQRYASVAEFAREFKAALSIEELIR